MKHFFIIGLIGWSVAATAQPLTLKQCVETAIKNNLEVKQAEWAAETNRINWKQSRASQVPFLSAGIGHGVNQGRSIDPFTNSYVNQEILFANYSITSNVVLWNGGNLRNTTQRDALAYEAGRMDLQQAKDNLTINVILAYLQVLNNEEQLNLSKQQTEITRQQAERLEILNRQGAIPPSVLYDIKGQLANDELNEINSTNNLETSKIALAQLLNIDYDPSIQLEKLKVDSDPVLYTDQADAIFQLAAGRFAQVKAAGYRKEVAAKELAAAKGSRLPAIVFNAGVGTNYSSAATTLNLMNTVDVPTNDYVIVAGSKTPVYTPKSVYDNRKIPYLNQWKNNFNSGISLGLRIPILNAAQARTRINMAEVAEKSAGFEAKTVNAQLRLHVQQSYLNMTSAYERLLKLQQQVNDFTESFKAAEVRFLAGVGTSVDYIIAKNNMDRAKGNLASAKYDYLLRTKVLDFYRGEALF